MLIDMGGHAAAKKNKISLQKILSTLSLIVRETDVAGWYEEDYVVGVMFTEVTLDTQCSVPAMLMTRVTQTLKKHLLPQQFQEISISFRVMNEVQHSEVRSESAVPSVYHGTSASDATLGPSA